MAASSAEFRPESSALAEVRAFVRAECPGLSDYDLLTFLIVVNELASNAVIHAAAQFRVELSTLRDAVRVEVHDPSDQAPRLRQTGPEDSGGRGLPIVAALSRAWGTEFVNGGGKFVWAEIVTPSKDPGR